MTGHTSLLDQIPILLPFPSSLRELKCIKEETKAMVLIDLEPAGFKLAQILQVKLDEGGEDTGRSQAWYMLCRRGK